MFSKLDWNELSLPALLLDIDAFDQNCKRIAEQANGKSIRVATKSVRSTSVLKRILASSPTFKGFMCFSPREAIFLARQGFDDLLLGYPCWDEEALREIGKWNRNGKKIICMIDDLNHLEMLERISEETEGNFYICIDIDMSTTFGPLHFGVRRSPIHSAKQLLPLIHKLKTAKGIQLVGIMGYEAQIAGVGDKMPTQTVKNIAVSSLKKRSITKIMKRRKEAVQILEEEGFLLELVNGGGTGSLHLTSKEELVTEVTVGSGFFSPLLFDYYKDFQYDPSLFFALPIVRNPAPNIYTCLGGGYVASGPPGKDKLPAPIYPLGGELLPFEAAGEVQTPVYFKNKTLNIGDPIVFRAAKAGEICERFTEIICVSNGKIVDRFPTYRGEGGCFL